MASAVTVTADCEGKTLDELSRLVAMRARALGETTRDAVIATAINIVTSLKAATKKAPLKANKKMYWVWKSSMVAGWERSAGATYRRVVRTPGAHGHVDRFLTRRCRNLVGKHWQPGEKVHVFALQLFNENLERTVYYAFAHNAKEVSRYAEDVILRRLLRKESGMMKYSMGMSQAKISSRPGALQLPHGAKQWKLAAQAAKIATGGSDKLGTDATFYLDYRNELRYSMKALRGGQGMVETALKKAANKTAGLIHLAYANLRFTEDVATPFPEVQRKK